MRPAKQAKTPSRFEWRIHHPSKTTQSEVTIEVRPLSGLLPRWRFVLPADFDGVVRWGMGETNMPATLRTAIRGISQSDGAVQLTDGPKVIWFGALEPLSVKVSAYLLFRGNPPHYVMFGQATSPQSPPQKLEGITFGDTHHTH